MSCVVFNHDLNVRALQEQLVDVQRDCADNRTCTQRRAERMPAELRVVYQQISQATNAAECQRLRQHAWRLRKEWVAESYLQSQMKKISQGKVICKSKKLHRVDRLCVDGQRIEDRSLWPTAAKAFYDQKWKAGDERDRRRIMEFVSASENCPITVSIEDVSNGFRRVRNKSKLDSDGICVLALEYLFISQPSAFTSWLSHVAGSTSCISDLSINGLVFGKESANTDIQDTRVILPLPSILGLLDAILPCIIEPIISRLFPIPHGVWFGALPKTQVLDIAHGLSAVIEKGLDLESSGAVGQSDIRQFFDTNDILRVFEFLVLNGLSQAVAAACVRHQLLPKISLQFGNGTAVIKDRCIGSLTGSRLAGMAARVPVHHTCCIREPIWREYGFSTNTGKLTMSTYVDNLFVAGRSCHGVAKFLDDAEAFLLSQWNLTIKPSSRLILAPLHSADTEVEAPAKYPVVQAMRVLGHILECDGSVNSCFENSVNCMWRAFYSNCAGKDASKLPRQHRLGLICKAVLPIVRSRWARWPFTTTRAQRLDAMQRKMMSIICSLRMDVGESFEGYVRRRGRELAQLQKRYGRWSMLWANAITGWADHLQRPINSKTWASRVMSLRTPAELAERRAVSGTPMTRSASGWVCRRWFESVQYACEYRQNSIDLRTPPRSTLPLARL